MEAAAGAIRFDIALDLGKIKTAIDETSQKLNEKFTGAFTGRRRNVSLSVIIWQERLKK